LNAIFEFLFVLSRLEPAPKSAWRHGFFSPRQSGGASDRLRRQTVLVVFDAVVLAEKSRAWSGARPATINPMIAWLKPRMEFPFLPTVLIRKFSRESIGAASRNDRRPIRTNCGRF
jgi:hypothetical protein